WSAILSARFSPITASPIRPTSALARVRVVMGVLYSNPPRWGRGLTHAGIERVAEAVAHEIDGEHGEEDGEAGEGGQPPGDAHEVAAERDHLAPGRIRAARAHAEEGERGLLQNGLRDLERGHDDDG